MKTINHFSKVLLLWALFTTSLFAQTTVNTDYATQINTVFQNVDKTKVPTQLLADYAMEFADLGSYGGLLTPENIVSKGVYNDIYSTLIMSRVATNVVMTNPSDLKTSWDNLRTPGKIVLSGLSYKYNKLRDDASPNYITISNNKLYDKYTNGVWQNPYLDKQVFAIAPPISSYNGLSFTVQLPTALWFTNQSKSIASLAIDFGDGQGYKSYAIGNTKTITYSQAGTYEWKYRLYLTNGTILYSHSKFTVKGESAQPTTTLRTINDPCDLEDGLDPIDFTGTRTYAGSANNAYIQIRYAANDCVIHKPLIVVEGFDTGLLKPEELTGEASILTFGAMANGTTVDLPAPLSTYDVIYVNWKNGRDYVQRNAYLLQDIIKWVNSVKTGNTPNVVWGMSMGGVIARYALRDMEVQQAATGLATWNHQTSLYISQDAPHQGANFPVGLQCFIRHMSNQFIGTPTGDKNLSPYEHSELTISDFQAVLNSPGTKQLLSNYVTGSYSLDNTVGTTFRTELKNLGYPQQTRNVALSNGDHCGFNQATDPDNPNLIFSLIGNGKTSFLTDFLTTVSPALGLGLFSFEAASYGEAGLLLGILPGSSQYSLNFSANKLPASGTTANVYKGRLTFTKKVLFFITVTTVLTDVERTNADFGITLPLDSYPGGNMEIKSSSPSDNTIFQNYGLTGTTGEPFCFIPTTSALDIGKGNVTLTATDYTAKYSTYAPPVAPKDTPFVNFITNYEYPSSYNNQHLNLTSSMDTWLAKEIDSDANTAENFSCLYRCQDNSITGASTICSASNFSIAATYGATYFNWSITEGANLVTMGANGATSVTITPVNSTVKGFITISLKFGDDNSSRCGNKTITKRVWVGKPSFYAERTHDYCENGKHWIVYEMIAPAGNDFTYSLVYPAAQGGVVSFGGNIMSVYFPPGYETDILTFQVKGTNACGYTNMMYEHTVSSCANLNNPYKPAPGKEEGKLEDVTENAGGDMYFVYPNPSNGIVNLKLFDENYVPAKGSKVHGELFDMTGRLKTKFAVNDNKANFSVAGFEQGIYILKVYINDHVEIHRIAVQ